MIRSKYRCFILFILFQLFFIPAIIFAETEITVYVGHSDVLDFDMPVKRVAIASPGIADATVTSPTQILINGKLSGRTSMIVWAENNAYTKYTIHVVRRASKHQVMLEVKFMEVNRSALKEFGSDFIVKNMKFKDLSMEAGAYSGKVTEPNDPLGLGNTVDFFFRIPNRNFESIYKAMHENNLITLLANPNICAEDGSEASFLAGGEFPIPIVSGSSGMQTVTIQFKEYGVKLGFKPDVLDSSLIHLDLQAEVSNLDFEHGVLLSGFQIPSLTTRKTTTSVELAEGEHLVIGGLLSNQQSKSIARIPVLGYIPVLGTLFSSRKYQNDESELVIALSPRIITTVDEKDIRNPIKALEEEENGKKGKTSVSSGDEDSKEAVYQENPGQINEDMETPATEQTDIGE